MKRPTVSLEKPRAVYITATDRATRKSRGTTIYGVTPREAIRLIRDALRQQEQQANDAA